MTIEKVKEALGETGTNMSDEQIEKLMSAFDYLSDYWLDQRETEIFGSPISSLLAQ